MLLESGPANVKTFRPNSSEVVIYPLADDPVLNKEAFRTWQFIRLPEEMSGANNDASSFRMFSSICLHLWYLWKYVRCGPDPQNPDKIAGGNGQCPCHGTMYEPQTGMAYIGPASLQAPPANVLPKLNLEVDSMGDLWILPPDWSPHRNGIIGYGRFLAQQ